MTVCDCEPTQKWFRKYQIRVLIEQLCLTVPDSKLEQTLSKVLTRMSHLGQISHYQLVIDHDYQAPANLLLRLWDMLWLVRQRSSLIARVTVWMPDGEPMIVISGKTVDYE